MTSKKCSDKQILNLTTNRCVLVGGNTFFKYLKAQTEKNELHFSQVDLEKHNYSVQTAKIPKKIIHTMTTYVDDIIDLTSSASSASSASSPKSSYSNISNLVKSKLSQKAEKIRLENYYINDEHKAYCKNTKRDTLLTTPIVNKFVFYRLSFIQSPLYEKFSPSIFEDFFKKDAFKIHELTDDHTVTLYSNNYDRLVNEKHENDILDIEWFNELNVYMSKLHYEDIFSILAYTFNGDTLINNHYRNNLDISMIRRKFKKNVKVYKSTIYLPLFFPLLNILKENMDHLENIIDTTLPIKKQETCKINILKMKVSIMTDFQSNKKKHELYVFIVDIVSSISEETIIKCIVRLADSLQKSIDGAPPLKKKMVVYRGSQDDYYFNKNIPNTYFRNKGFVSTSINKKAANQFVNKTATPNSSSKCCLSYITLLPGTKTLWLEGSSQVKKEYEFLLGMNTTYLIRNHKVETKILKDDNFDICDKTAGITVYTSDIVALS